MNHGLFLLGLAAVAHTAHANGALHLRAMPIERQQLRSLIADGSFEAGDAAPNPGWDFWGLGYTLDSNIARTGSRSARCSRADGEGEYGVMCRLHLDQATPRAVLVSVWSRASNVSGSPSSGYSLYVDIEYQDGTPEWGLNRPFETGSHDWQQRRVVIRPVKPIKTLVFYGLFRWHEGTVWFDDFEAGEAEGSGGDFLYDAVPVAPAAPADLPPVTHHLSAGHGVELGFAADGTLVREDRLGGFVARDVAQGSDLRRLTGVFDGRRLSARDDELGIGIEADFHELREGLRIDAVVQDLVQAGDRPVTVYFAIPAPRENAVFGLDPRRAADVGPSGELSNARVCRVGAAGRASLYPFAPLATPSGGVSIGAPLSCPRVWRFAYNADAEELFAAADVVLSPSYQKTPSAASLSLVIFGFDAAWGFRSALEAYYRLFPEDFHVRVGSHGIWMPFSPISKVEGHEDFGFRFKEGHDEAGWDDEHDVLTFVYVEPSSNWLAMPEDLPRTPDAALAHMNANSNLPQNRATVSSAITGPNGQYYVHVVNAPWCDGALFLLNPSPTVEPGLAGLSQYDRLWQTIRPACSDPTVESARGWNPFASGYSADANVSNDGARSIRVESEGDRAAGASQSLTLRQTEPKRLVLSGWSRAAGVEGPAGGSYSLYADLVLADGTPLYARVAPFSPGTHEWEYSEVVIEAPQPIRLISVYCLLRAPLRGTAWFDAVSLKEEGSDRNLLDNSSFEEPGAPGTVDGTYVDSLEMAAWDPNYRPDHIAVAATPPTFDEEGKTVLLHAFSIYEFCEDLAERMHALGKLTFANGALWTLPWYACQLDVLGTELNFGTDSQYRPDPDSIFCFRRALSGRKPYVVLLNTDYDQFGQESVRRYFERCLFYGVFPSMFSHNAADNPYWQNPNWYNRDRELFRKYIPLVRKLSVLGWEPVTYATSSNGSVYVERWGHGPTFALTVHNDTDATQDATVEIDFGALGAADPLSLHDEVTGETMSVESVGGRPSRVAVTLGPWQTRMLVAGD